MGSLPEGYKPVGFQYSDSQPTLTDRERQRIFWKERNEAITQKNRELREKSQVTTLQDVYARPKQEAPVSPRPFNPIGSMRMPPGDKDVELAKKRYFGIVDEQTQIADLSAKIAELEKRLQ